MDLFLQSCHLILKYLSINYMCQIYLVLNGIKAWKPILMKPYNLYDGACSILVAGTTAKSFQQIHLTVS